MKINSTLALFFSLFFLNILQAQLSPGDIAFIGFNTDAQEGFSIITLTDIPSSEVIYFTDRGVINNTTWNTAIEETWRFTAPSSGVACGTIISFVDIGDVYDISGITGASMVWQYGSIGSQNINHGPGDQMLAYQSTATPTAASVIDSGVTFISGIHTNYAPGESNSTNFWTESSFVSSTSESALPPGLTNEVDCISFDAGSGETTEFDNFKYNGTLTGTSAILRAAINNPTNWTKNISPTLDISPSSYSGVNVDCSTLTLDKFINNRFLVYPNPSNGYIKVISEEKKIDTISITDLNGRVIINYVFNGERIIHLSLNSKLTSGFYLMSITSGNESVVKRIIIN